LLPTFALDSAHRLRYAVSIDGQPPIELDASGPKGQGPDTATWSANVLRNSAVATTQIASLSAGHHTLRLIYRDPGVVFEHIVLTFPGAPPAYPVPPETSSNTQ
jgi:Gylcosyl hydrolase family 115 C-terminal domain